MKASRAAYLVWGVGLFAYLMAVCARAAFGVAGLDAQDRYHATAGILATFAVLQLAVYAMAQVPMGILLDRYGSRILLSLGMTLITIGTVLLSLTTTTSIAIFARFITGAGDAAIFVSVVRLLMAWFPPQRVPLMQQFTGMTGQLGQLLSAAPLSFALHNFGWTKSFLAMGLFTAVAGLMCGLAVRNQPPQTEAMGGKKTMREVRGHLSDSLRTPGTRLGFWSHLVSQFSGNVFGLLWGVPFLVIGQGLSREVAASMLTVMVVCGMVLGLLMGHLAGRFPLRRSNLIIGSTTLILLSWSAVLLWPGRAPLWLIVVMVACIASGNTASMVSLDYARTFNPSNRAGVATGIVNTGGFVASLLVIWGVGMVLDYLARSGQNDLFDFKIAMLVQYPFWIAGIAFVYLERRKTIRALAAGGVDRSRTLTAIREHMRRPKS